MSYIAFSETHKAFGRRHILQGVGISLREGQCCLLTGQNGAGKSTLQRIIAGLERPDSAQVDVGDGYHSWKAQRKFLQANCVYLHQQPFMFDGSVAENLAYALPRTLTKAERLHRIQVALTWAGLEDIAECWAKTISGGERQRVALARAWLRSPRYMLLDEPSNNLDEDAKRRTLTLLESLKVQGIAMVVASHEAEQYRCIADEQLDLAQGRISARTGVGSTLPPSNIIPINKFQQA